MASCPNCGHRPIRRKEGVRKCRRCGVLPDPGQGAQVALALVAALAITGCAETYYGCRQHGGSREDCYLSTPGPGRA